MMLVIFAVAAVGTAYWLASVYVARAQRSFENARLVWVNLSQSLEAFVRQGPPVAVAQLAMALATAAGCGCFVRGLVITHYLPRFGRRKPDRPNGVEAAFNDSRSMEPAMQAAFDQIMASAFIYDSFSNPIQGWLFRRVMRSFTEPNQTWSEQIETKLAAFSVMSNRGIYAH